MEQAYYIIEDLGLGPGFHIAFSVLGILAQDESRKLENIRRARLGLRRLRQNAQLLDDISVLTAARSDGLDGVSVANAFSIIDADLKTALAMLCALPRYRFDRVQKERILDYALAALGRYLERQSRDCRSAHARRDARSNP